MMLQTLQPEVQQEIRVSARGVISDSMNEQRISCWLSSQMKQKISPCTIRACTVPDRIQFMKL